MSDKQRSTSQVEGKHTLGPWKAIGDKIYSADKRQVAHVYALVHPDNLNVMQSIPNAKLLAAAPEMLRLIQRLTSPYMAEPEYRMDAFIDANEIVNQILQGDD